MAKEMVTKESFGKLTEAEAMFLEQGYVHFGEHLPEKGDKDKIIRAEIIERALYGQIEGFAFRLDRLDIQGIKIEGNLVVFSLDMPAMVTLSYCVLLDGLQTPNCKFNDLLLINSRVGDFAGTSINVTGTLMLYGTTFSGNVSFTLLRAGTFVDDKNSWPEKGLLCLRGAIYERFAGNSPTTARERLDWLSRMPEFHPQPYRQLAKVFREAGQDQDARDVLYEMEWLRARDQKFKTAATVAHLRQGGDDALPEQLERYHGKTRRVSVLRLLRAQAFKNVLNYAFDCVIGYGYKLERAGMWIVGMIALLSVLSSIGYHTGYMAPNSAPILVSNDWKDSTDAKDWMDTSAGRDWETFFAPIYAADVILPLIDFGQESAWAPTTRGPLGYILWAIRWPLKLMGWIIVSLTVATMTGVVQRRHDM